MPDNIFGNQTLMNTIEESNRATLEQDLFKIQDQQRQRFNQEMTYSFGNEAQL